MDVATSVLEGFLGIDAVSGASLDALELCELLSKLIITCSRAMALAIIEDCSRKISTDEQSLLFLYQGFINGGRIGSRISYIFFQK